MKLETELQAVAVFQLQFVIHAFYYSRCKTQG